MCQLSVMKLDENYSQILTCVRINRKYSHCQILYRGGNKSQQISLSPGNYDETNIYNNPIDGNTGLL
jgi:hypothetical protein